MNIEVDGYNIAYKCTGQGEETVVILQGWGTHLGVYDPVMQSLCEKYRVVQFDFPGFGASDEPREPWSVDDYADFFCHFMEQIGVEKATLFGHSYGGRVIIKLASRISLPFEIERIVLMDSAGIVPPKSLRQRFKIQQYKMLKKFLNLKVIYALFPEVIDDWRSRQGSADYRAASPMMRQCLVKAVNEDLTELLPAIQQETLLIWGEQDTATPLSDGKLMEQRIPHAGLAVLPQAGHFPFVEQPALFRSILRSYFKVG